jgi:hypothetical protein
MTTKKSGGAKTSRSETVTIRLTPDGARAARLVAAAEFRTLSSLIQVATHTYVLERYPDAMNVTARLEIVDGEK